jgi:AcrR family transcriptional regulator
MSGPSDRVDPRTLRTTAAILDAAEGPFREHGFHLATMDEIAERAGVAVGSIYFHFGSKDALYLALVERALDVNERYMAEAYGEGRSPLEEVLAAGDAYLRFHLEHPGYFRMIALRGFDVPDGEESTEAQQRIADRVELLVGAVGEALTRAVAAGQVVTDDPQDAAIFLWGAWNGVVALHQRPDRLRLDDERLREILAVGRRIVFVGLASDGVRADIDKFL